MQSSLLHSIWKVFIVIIKNSILDKFTLILYKFIPIIFYKIFLYGLLRMTNQCLHRLLLHIAWVETNNLSRHASTHMQPAPIWDMYVAFQLSIPTGDYLSKTVLSKYIYLFENYYFLIMNKIFVHKT